jgi:hypothetical protein
MVVLALGALLRGLALIASGPISLYLNDSRDYLERSRHLVPDGYHPLGYPLFLALVRGGDHPLLLAWVQHGLGLLTGLLVIQAALRLGLPAWGAALAAAPVLLDPYVVAVEQTVVAESLFMVLVTAALLVLIRGRKGTGAWAAGGALLGAAVLVRTAGLAVVAGVALWLVVRRPGWLPALALTAALLVPVGAYAGWFSARHGSPGLTQYGGVYLYGRLAPFADCAGLSGLDAAERSLCDTRPVSERPQPDFYLWQPGSPLKQLSPDVGARSTVAARTGRAMAWGDPGAWVRSTAGYLVSDLAFGPWRTAAWRKDSTLATFRADIRRSTAPVAGDPRLSDGFRVVGHTTAWATTALRGYQRVVGAPYALLMVLPVAGLWRSRRRPGPQRQDPRRQAAGVLALSAGALLVAPALTVGDDVRFLLVTLPLLGLASALAGPLARGERRDGRGTA